MRIMGIDPGLRCTGVAWGDLGNPELIQSYSVRVKPSSLQNRISNITASVINQYLAGLAPDVVIIEKPQVYQGHLQKGDPNDLIDLAILVGQLMSSLSFVWLSTILLPTPAQWKGQIPKDIHHRRIRKQCPHLGSISKDAMDAAGLVLYGMEYYHANTKKR